LIAPWLAAPGRLAAGPTAVDWAVWLGFVLASTAVTGVPLLFWSLDHGRTRLAWLASFGAIAGVASMTAAVAIGVLSCVVQGGRRYVAIVLRHGAPVPMAGIVPWAAFLADVGQAVVVGVLTAVAWRLLVVRTARGS